MTLPGGIPTIGAMDDELQALENQVDRLLAAMRRLADENRTLKGEIADLQRAAALDQERMRKARERLLSALARLPEHADSIE